MAERTDRAADRPKTSKSPRLQDRLTAAKVNFVLDAVRRSNLLAGEKTYVLSARLNEALVLAAKEGTGITSDTELVETALAMLAADDDFVAWLVAQGGRLCADFEIDF